MNEPIDVFLLAGFLGSGKTSLLLRYLERNAADTAVIVNDAGEVNIDGAIIQSEAAPLRLTLLTNGCVCCSSAGELSATIEALLEARSQLALPSLRRIIVEASGLSRPGPLLRQIAALAGYPLRTRVVSTWDCTRSNLLLEFEEAHAQVTGANRIILTKRDRVSAAQIERAKRLVRSLNPFASIIDEVSLEAGAASAFADTVERHERETVVPPTVATRPHPRTLIWNHRFTASVDWDAMAEWLDNLAGLSGERLLRVKGLVPVTDEDRLVLVQGVGTLFSPPRTVATPCAPFLVVIARDMTATDIENVTPPLLSQRGLADRAVQNQQI